MRGTSSGRAGARVTVGREAGGRWPGRVGGHKECSVACVLCAVRNLPVLRGLKEEPRSAWVVVCVQLSSQVFVVQFLRFLRE